MYEKYLEILRKDLPIGESFDILERKFRIGGRKASMFFTDGLTNGQNAQFMLNYLLSIKKEDMDDIADSKQFLEEKLPFLDSNLIEPKKGLHGQKSSFEQTESDMKSFKGQQQEEADESDGRLDNADVWTKEMIEDCCRQAEQKMYSGLTVLDIQGMDRLIFMDMRNYPSRSVEEPEKEKSLRGAKDGFTENLMENISMIRRRIRDNNLIASYYSVGRISKTDVVVTYMKNKVNVKLLEKLEGQLQCLDAESLTVGDQSLVERLLKSVGGYSKLNPFPKVRYSQRPDIIAAHVAEGKIAIIVDNSPTVMLLPVGIFDFLQDIDDYYFPQVTGNYFRLLRTVNFLVILFLIPVYLLIIEYKEFTPEILKFFIPEEDFAVPILLQFILLEVAIDGLKLASLNTPDSLGMSLSVIGALILGEFSVSSGWFIPQTILCMAVVALASFTQPSIELSYGIKFSRVLMMLGAGFFGAVGFAAGVVVSIFFLATTRTLSGDSYLYPLVPFRWKALKRLLFRCEK